MNPPVSKVKLGLLILWPTFWTGFPIKVAVVLLLLAAGLHPWEGSGLGFLMLLSVPIDIWALGVCARTVFLERMRVDVPNGLGLSLWWKWALFSGIYLPLLYVVVGSVASVGKTLASGLSHFLNDHVVAIPVAEQITLELVVWGSMATVALIVLLLGWFYGLGWLAFLHVKDATPVNKPYEEIVRYWDLLRIPRDQPLFLTAMTGTGVVMVFLFWALLPATTPHPHEEYEYTYVTSVEKPIQPLEVLKKAEKVIANAERVVSTLKESESQKKDGKEVKGKIQKPQETTKDTKEITVKK